MAVKDLSLNSFLLPNIPSLRDDIGFGRTVDPNHNDGSLTITEFAKDLSIGFKYQELEDIFSDNTTTDVERNGGFNFTGEGSLAIGKALRSGLKIEVTTSMDNGENIFSFPVDADITEFIPIQPGMSVTIQSTKKEVETGKYGWRICSIELNGSKLSAKNTEGTIYYSKSRWLRFVKDEGHNSDRKSLKVLAGTFIRLDTPTAHRWFCAAEDRIFDMSEFIHAGENGLDFGVYLEEKDDELEFTAYPLSTTVSNPSKKIGRFHTLCNSAGSGLTAIVPGSVSYNNPTTDTQYTNGNPINLNVGNKYLVMPYNKESDPDFYDLYNCEITNIEVDATANPKAYSVLTVKHPLSFYTTGDILPESIWCLSFKPNSIYEDAMCYNKFSNTANDIYIMSGNGEESKSAYNEKPTVNRKIYNLQEDLRAVGKKPLGDMEFTAAALGSNENTKIYGSPDVTFFTGGHYDASGGTVEANGRRMISFIGLEECCGFFWQVLDEIVDRTSDNASQTDGKTGTNFGKEYGIPYILLGGGSWDNTAATFGARCRLSANLRSDARPHFGERGSCGVNQEL